MGTAAVSKKILVVDDEDSVRLFLQDFLFDRDFNAIAAATGEEALEKMAKEKPDIVLLDITMPGMSGLECLERIKEKFPKTVVIMMSAQTEVSLISRAKQLGAFDYITKPFSLEDLESELVNLIRQSGSAGSGEKPA